MLVVPVLLSLLWAICSTVLVWPWFWKGLMRKTKIGNEKYMGFSEDDELIAAIIIQVIYACFTFCSSLTLYLTCNLRYNFYGATFSILFICLFQFLAIGDGWKEKRRLKLLIIFAIAVVCLFFSITDSITSDFDVVGLTKNNEEVPVIVSIAEKGEEQQQVFPSSTIAGLFKADSASDPVYSNGMFVYTITGSPNGYGIVIIDENAGEAAKFIACNFKFEMSLSIRTKYPFARVKELNVVISDDGEPFGKYAILSKPKLFGAPVLDKYVLQNMITGELSEYLPEELPKFAE